MVGGQLHLTATAQTRNLHEVERCVIMHDKVREPWTETALTCTHVSIISGYLLVDTE